MSIWMLLIFALCMLAGVASVDAPREWAHLAMPTFAGTLVAFLTGLVRRGIRRPVV